MTNKDWREEFYKEFDVTNYGSRMITIKREHGGMHTRNLESFIKSLLEQERKAAKKELIEELKEIAKDKKFSSEETDITAGWNMGIDKLLNEACKITKSKVQTYNLDPDI